MFEFTTCVFILALWSGDHVKCWSLILKQYFLNHDFFIYHLAVARSTQIDNTNFKIHFQIFPSKWNIKENHWGGDFIFILYCVFFPLRKYFIWPHKKVFIVETMIVEKNKEVRKAWEKSIQITLENVNADNCYLNCLI